MSIRAKCQRDGHKFREIEGVSLPYVFCARWRCDASAVSRFADDDHTFTPDFKEHTGSAVDELRDIKAAAMATHTNQEEKTP